MGAPMVFRLVHAQYERNSRALLFLGLNVLSVGRRRLKQLRNARKHFVRYWRIADIATASEHVRS